MGFISKIDQWLHKCRQQAALVTAGERDIRGDCVRIPSQGVACALQLGGERGRTLHLYPAPPLVTGDGPGPLLLVEEARFFQEMAGFLHLTPGMRVVLGRHDEDQNRSFRYPARVASRHLVLQHQGTHVLIQDLHTDSGSHLRLLNQEGDADRMPLWRHGQLATIRHLYGGVLQLLPPAEALRRLQKAHERTCDHLSSPDWCDGHEAPPAIVQLPRQTIPILVGDLHGHLDHLLTLLTLGGCLGALAAGRATLILLGDAVHPDEGDDLRAMADSMLMMDLIFSLMIHFPGQVIYIRGNHDGFEEEIYKRGISQGRAWHEALLDARGEAYVAAMQAWYRDLPYIVVHPRVVACHASPFVVKVDRLVLSRLRQYPGLLRQLVWNRIHQPHRPGGYTAKDVQRFRQVLGVSPQTPLVVGHTPMDDRHTLWLHAGGIEHHHVLYAGHPRRMGWLTWSEGELLVQEYPVENLRGEPAGG